jgi:hypothetical protein
VRSQIAEVKTLGCERGDAALVAGGELLTAKVAKGGAKGAKKSFGREDTEARSEEPLIAEGTGDRY